MNPRVEEADEEFLAVEVDKEFDGTGVGVGETKFLIKGNFEFIKRFVDSGVWVDLHGGIQILSDGVKIADSFFILSEFGGGFFNKCVESGFTVYGSENKERFLSARSNERGEEFRGAAERNVGDVVFSTKNDFTSTVDDCFHDVIADGLWCYGTCVSDGEDGFIAYTENDAICLDDEWKELVVSIQSLDILFIVVDFLFVTGLDDSTNVLADVGGGVGIDEGDV